MNPERDLATLLDGTNGLTGGTNLFRGHTHEPDGAITQPTVWVKETGTGSVTPFLEGSTGGDYTSAHVRVLVLAPRQGYSTTYDLAQTIFETLHKAEIAGYTKVVALQGRPASFLDEEGRSFFTMTFRAEYKSSR